jgi:hypothetical protein
MGLEDGSWMTNETWGLHLVWEAHWREEGRRVYPDHSLPLKDAESHKEGSHRHKVTAYEAELNREKMLECSRDRVTRASPNWAGALSLMRAGQAHAPRCKAEWLPGSSGEQ